MLFGHITRFSQVVLLDLFHYSWCRDVSVYYDDNVAAFLLGLTFCWPCIMQWFLAMSNLTHKFLSMYLFTY